MIVDSYLPAVTVIPATKLYHETAVAAIRQMTAYMTFDPNVST
jgi:hypothetical protein